MRAKKCERKNAKYNKILLPRGVRSIQIIDWIIWCIAMHIKWRRRCWKRWFAGISSCSCWCWTRISIIFLCLRLVHPPRNYRKLWNKSSLLLLLLLLFILIFIYNTISYLGWLYARRHFFKNWLFGKLARSA